MYRSDSDTALLIDVMSAGGYAVGRRVLDIGTGTGALALAAASAGVASVTAVDLSRRSVAATWINCRIHRVQCTVHRGDLFEPVIGQHIDLILANPPYVPGASQSLSRHSIRRCWDGGLDGRAVLDRLCTFGPVMRLRAAMLEARGLIEPGQRDEELVVIAARAPAGAQRAH